MVAGPQIVLSAFSSELFLKCLYSIESERSPPRGHNLKTLFKELSLPRRKKIIELWDAYAATREPFWCAAEQTVGQALSRDFLDVLDEGARGFEKMRYAYEDEAFRFRLADLPGMLRTVVLEVRPEWESAPVHLQPLSTSPTR